MIKVTVGKYKSKPADTTYSHAADVTMLVGEREKFIGVLRFRRADGDIDYDPCGTVLEDEACYSETFSWGRGFTSVNEAIKWLEIRLNSRELMAHASGGK